MCLRWCCKSIFAAVTGSTRLRFCPSLRVCFLLIVEMVHFFGYFSSQSTKVIFLATFCHWNLCPLACVQLLAECDGTTLWFLCSGGWAVGVDSTNAFCSMRFYVIVSIAKRRFFDGEYLSYFSVGVTTQHGRGNLQNHLVGTRGSRMLKSITVMVGSVIAGRQSGMAT